MAKMARRACNLRAIGGHTSGGKLPEDKGYQRHKKTAPGCPRAGGLNKLEKCAIAGGDCVAFPAFVLEQRAGHAVHAARNGHDL